MGEDLFPATYILSTQTPELVPNTICGSLSLIHSIIRERSIYRSHSYNRNVQFWYVDKNNIIPVF